MIGFVITHVPTKSDLVYVTGDTCWYEGVEEVSRRYRPESVVLFGGAAQTRGPFHLTMDTNDALETAAHFPHARIVPLHHEGWQHFTQSAADLRRSFAAVGRDLQLLDLPPGQEVELLPWRTVGGFVP